MIEKFKDRLKARIMWRSTWGEYLSKLYDIWVFTKYRFAEQTLRSRENYVAFITKQYHIIEKGMALPEPRKGFGKEKIEVLMSTVEEYEKNYGRDHLSAYVRAVLQQYLERNAEFVNKEFLQRIRDFVGSGEKTAKNVGTKQISLMAVREATSFDYSAFVNTRTSVRNFSDEPVNEQEVWDAFENARHTPSVCNRQSWKAYMFSGTVKDELLRLQGGNQGFSQSIDKVLLITTDIRKFTQMESNQVYVDGGLFSMSVLFALHHKNIASCPLNLCKPFTDEQKIAGLAGVPLYERLIMMIGIGNYRDNFEVAASPKNKVEDILIVK